MKNINMRKALTIKGQVQGVGFRPFIWRLAQGNELTGFVCNAAAGVRIEIQGAQEKIEKFKEQLQRELPPLAKITAIEETNLEVAPEKDFQIKASKTGGTSEILVSPDVGACDECLAEIGCLENRRFGYAFTNCTNCGPRFSITENLPYDRKFTVMKCFALCPACSAEYENPADRRFHAQPVACPVCGPQVWLVTAEMLQKKDTSLRADPKAIETAADLILEGKIVALKGLGGFQLACDARNDVAVKLLRQRKKRPHKALAVMAQNLEDVSLFCDLQAGHKQLLFDAAKPIVVCPAKNEAALPLSAAINPDSNNIGVMLPNTPLHFLLLQAAAAKGEKAPVFVMTSANPAGEPICLGNREALSRLADLADAWLLHNRDILCRVDDSVVGIGADCDAGPASRPVFIRRARGYVPAPLSLADGHSACVLGAGAELKTTFCLTRNSEAFPGQHIGDLKSPALFEFYQQSLKHLQNLLQASPQAVVCDSHPNFITSQFSQEYARQHSLPLWRLQHHAAHAAAVLAENKIFKPALALCMDGFGLGPDGELWGGELVKMDLSAPDWQRVGSLRPFPLPGGDKATEEPWRIAKTLGFLTGKPAAFTKFSEKDDRAIGEMLKKGINSPLTSSCGRLFDGVAALAGLCEKITYEGQAPMLLEKQALQWRNSADPEKLPVWDCPVYEKNGICILDIVALVGQFQDFIESGCKISEAAAAFHINFARGLAQLCLRGSRMAGVTQVGLSGGVMQNILLTDYLIKFLQEAGLQPLPHRHLPPGDGCIATGQAVWGRAMLARFN